MIEKLIEKYNRMHSVHGKSPDYTCIVDVKYYPKGNVPEISLIMDSYNSMIFGSLKEKKGEVVNFKCVDDCRRYLEEFTRIDEDLSLI